MRQLVKAELHQSACSECHRRKAEHGRIPAALRNIERIDQPTIYFIGDDNRSDKFFDIRLLGFCNGEARCDVVARMNGKTADIGVIKVEVAGSGTVSKGGHFRCCFAMGAYDRSSTIDGKRDLAADADWLLVPRTHATADRIDHKRLHPLNGLWVEVFIAKLGSIISEPFGKRSIV